MMRRPHGFLSGLGLALGVAVIGWAHMSLGGNPRLFLQPEALAVVFGGTAAALLVSFSASTLWSAFTGVIRLAFRRPTPIEMLVPAFMRYASIARRQGMPAVEKEAARAGDEFLARALSLSVGGLAPNLVRQTLDIDTRMWAEREEERAQVLDAAAGYAPTLGIIGAVLGLMRVMQQFTTADAIGAGIAAAFVSTIYGLGAANLLFLPLATRVRARARREALRRDLVADGVLALHDGASPGLVEDRLSGYLHDEPSAVAEVA
jgi:chemotaxis protein MotA